VRLAKVQNNALALAPVDGNAAPDSAGIPIRSVNKYLCVEQRAKPRLVEGELSCGGLDRLLPGAQGDFHVLPGLIFTFGCNTRPQPRVPLLSAPERAWRLDRPTPAEACAGPLAVRPSDYGEAGKQVGKIPAPSSPCSWCKPGGSFASVLQVRAS
jgi:hypothetical protein